jgi:Secretion system C-terminal sorting domain
LKEVDKDGAYVYSKVLKIAGKENNNSSVKVFPNPVTSSATLSVNSKENKTATIKVYSNSGKLVKQITRQLGMGTTNIDIPSVNTLANGMYTVMMDNSAVQFIKQ